MAVKALYNFSEMVNSHFKNLKTTNVQITQTAYYQIIVIQRYKKMSNVKAIFYFLGSTKP